MNCFVFVCMVVMPTSVHQEMPPSHIELDELDFLARARGVRPDKLRHETSTIEFDASQGDAPSVIVPTGRPNTHNS